MNRIATSLVFNILCIYCKCNPIFIFFLIVVIFVKYYNVSFNSATNITRKQKYNQVKQGKILFLLSRHISALLFVFGISYLELWKSRNKPTEFDIYQQLYLVWGPKSMWCIINSKENIMFKFSASRSFRNSIKIWIGIP